MGMTCVWLTDGDIHGFLMCDLKFGVLDTGWDWSPRFDAGYGIVQLMRKE